MNKDHKLRLSNVYLLLILIYIVFSGCNGSRIYKTAYLTPSGNMFLITLRGKGVGHPAGPIDIFFPKTFNDSMQYLIPRNEGIIKGEEFPHKDCCYEMTGSITIIGSKLKIALYAKNTDDKKLDPDTWNGEYDLIRK